MKNTIKMSLVAAVAVAGLSTSASAGNLEEMLKDTTLSGKMEVGYNWYSVDSKNPATQDTTTNEWEYDFDATLNTKVNDIVSAQLGIQADNESTQGRTTSSTAGGTGDEHINITKLNFTAKTDMATVIVGKQTQPTPFLDDDRGNGVVALVPAGPVTLAAGHFVGMTGGAATADGHALNVNLSDRDINAFAAIAKVGPVDINAWYLMASGAKSATGLTGLGNPNSDVVEKGVDGYSINLKTNIAGVSLELAHASLELDSRTGFTLDAETLTKAVVGYDAGNFSVFAGYGKTNDANHIANGTAVNHTRLHGVDLSGDDDAATNFALEYTKLDAHNDATAWLIGGSMPMGAYTFTAQYLTAEVENHTAGQSDTDVEEINLEVSYAMSPNFTISGLYATQELDANGTNSDTDRDTLQLSMLYKF